VANPEDLGKPPKWLQSSQGLGQQSQTGSASNNKYSSWRNMSKLAINSGVSQKQGSQGYRNRVGAGYKEGSD